MKALVLDKANSFRYEEREYPECEMDSVTVHIEAVCICGSDVHAILGHQPLFSFPRVIGHEVSGTVVETGEKVQSLKKGDRVCLLPCIPCGKCRACKKGKTNTCKNLQLYGVHTDGGLQEYLNAPADSFMKVPETMSAEEAAMLEPLAIGNHAVAKLSLSTEDIVLVEGAGPIGVSCALNVKTYGAEVILTDVSQERRRFVKEQFGLEVLDPVAYDYNDTVRRITQGRLFDAVIDTTAVKSVMENDWRYIAYGGAIVFVGICQGVLELPGIEFHMKEPSLFVTRNSTKADFQRIIDFIEKGEIIPRAFITHTVSFEEAKTRLPEWVKPENGTFKGVVRFEKEV